MAPEGTQVNSINVTVPSLGVLTGAGTISPEGALNFDMVAELAGGGGGKERGGVPFVVEGTAANPKIVPDVKGVAKGAAKQAIAGRLVLRRVRNPRGRRTAQKETLVCSRSRKSFRTRPAKPHGEMLYRLTDSRACLGQTSMESVGDDLPLISTKTTTAQWHHWSPIFASDEFWPHGIAERWRQAFSTSGILRVHQGADAEASAIDMGGEGDIPRITGGLL